MTDEERRALRPGDKVMVRGDSGNEFEYVVKSAPWQLGGGTWVVGLVGISGGYLLSRVARVVPLTLAEFWERHAEWSQATFGPDGERGPTGPLNHLAKEVREALANPDDLTEYADLVFLVFDAARRAGFSYAQLEEAVTRKLAVNKARRWGPRSADGVVEHVREPAPAPDFDPIEKGG